MSRRGRIRAAAAWVAGLGGIAVLAVMTGLIGGPITPTSALGAPRFVEEAAAAGLAHTYDGGLVYFTGGGIAAFDCDDDGLADLYASGGEHPAALFRNDSLAGGALRFSRVAGEVTDLVGVTGAYPLDVDGDGRIDLAVLRVGGATLLRGLGDCTFENADAAWSFDGGDGWATAFSATWEAGASWPTLAVGNYLAIDAERRVTQGCADHLLVRPAQVGPAFAEPIPLGPGFCTLSMLFSDWDRSGRRDLRVSNDRHYYTDGQEQLWRIAAGEPPRLYTAADGWVSMQIWGMGIASQDLTGDGLPEVYLTSQGDNKLQTLTIGPESPTFRDIALKRGVTAAQPATGGDALPSTAWHPEFADVNNDGFTDLFVSKGNVSAMPEFASRDPSDLFLGGPDGTFTQAVEAAGIVNFDRARGAALVDLNGDGLLDLVTVNLGAPMKLWRNVGGGDAATPTAMGHWVGLHVTQPGPNRDAIGAWLEVRIGERLQWRELTVGGGHAGGQLGWIHLGLGPSATAEVRVHWPDGEPGPWLRVAADGFYRVERGASEAVRLTDGGP